MTLRELTELIVKTPTLADQYGKAHTSEIIVQVGNKQYCLSDCYTNGKGDLILVAKEKTND